MGHGFLEGDFIAAHGRRRDVHETNALAGPRTFLDIDLFAVKAHGFRRHIQLLRTQCADLLPQLEGTELHGLAGHIGGTGGIGAGIIGRGIRIGARHHDVLQGAFQHLRRNLRHGGVTAGAHVRRADGQGVEAVIINLQGRTADVHRTDAGALHGHAHTDAPYLAVPHVPAGVLMIPVDHLPHLLEAAVQGTAGVHLAVVSRHHIAFMDNVFLPQCDRVHVQCRRQFIDRGFHRKESLGRAVAPVGTGRHNIGIDHVTHKAEGLGLAIEGNGLVAGKSHGGGAVLAVGAGIG